MVLTRYSSLSSRHRLCLQEAVLEAARKGFAAEGIELNPTLHLVATMRAALLGLKGAMPGNTPPPRFHLGNMFSINLARYDVVMVFGGEWAAWALLSAKLDAHRASGAWFRRSGASHAATGGQSV